MMQVSAKTEYGLRCLLQLARQQDGKALSIPEIAQREHLPRQYAQQILLKLGKAGIVKSSRGIQGGFILARPAAEISLGAILRILEGVPFQDTCDHFNRKTDCGHLSDCSIRPVWQIVSRRLWDVVDKINLAQLILDEKNVRQRLLVELPVLNQ
jgi:Rrf2 family transcriptional regulator, iron-sulfur cluster assembly transcription factor